MFCMEKLCRHARICGVIANVGRMNFRDGPYISGTQALLVLCFVARLKVTTGGLNKRD